MSGVTVAFESKAPHTTPWLSIEFPVGEEPEEFLAKLAAMGWKEDRLRRLPPPGGIQEIVLNPPKGTGPLRSWTKEDARRHMPAARRLMRQYGFDRVPWNRLDMADLI